MEKGFRKLRRIFNGLILLAILTAFAFAYSCSGSHEDTAGNATADTSTVMVYRGASYDTDKGGGSFVITGEGIRQIITEVQNKKDRENERLYAAVISLVGVIWLGVMGYIRILANSTKAVAGELSSFRLEFAAIKQWKEDKDRDCEKTHNELNIKINRKRG